MELITLLENTACQGGLFSAHGLSMYLKAAGKRILFDMGPDEGFLSNAVALGVDLTSIDVAIVSHGHYDHTGGLKAFLDCNHHAQVYIHQGAFAPYYHGPDQYIGIPGGLESYAHRFIMVDGTTEIAPGLTLFDQVTDLTGATAASAELTQMLPDGTFRVDDFHHEQNLLIQEGDTNILIAGCAHRGILNILTKAEAMVGGEVTALVGGFHLFQLNQEDPHADQIIDQLSQGLRLRNTQYYTGHCTGDYAYGRLKAQLGNQLQRISGGYNIQI